MSVFVMSDLHLSVSGEKSMDVFGGEWTDYMSKIKERWENTVGSSDSVIIPGDVSWAGRLKESLDDFSFLDSLNGTKYIIKGNHDHWWDTLSKMTAFFTNNGFNTLNIVHNNAYLCENIIICGSRGWFDEAEKPKKSLEKFNGDNKKLLLRELQRMKISLEAGKKIKKLNPEAKMEMFLHFPPIYGEYKCHEILEVLECYNIKKCYFGHLHGATKNTLVSNYNGIEFELVSADYISFIPKGI